MPIHTSLILVETAPENPTMVLLGRKNMLFSETWRKRLKINVSTWKNLFLRLHPGDHGASTTTWVDDQKIKICVLPNNCSRHNSPSRAWAIPNLLANLQSSQNVSIIAVINKEHDQATAMSIARAFPLFSHKSGKKREQRVFVELQAEGTSICNMGFQHKMDAVRYAAKLVDMPTNQLNVTDFIAEANSVSQKTKTRILVTQGDDLAKNGFGGIWNVGKAAINKPAFVRLHWEPENPTASFAWVGKGIVYDTGGLSIKSKTGMPGMKGDMGGAAAVLAAFQAAALQKVPYRVTAILCLAENAVGPESLRPDDVIVMKSGKSVEINNTDAEGRLVLADGVYWAATHIEADIIIDIATLTGAASISVGKTFGALYSNNEALEGLAVRVGRSVGEPCHPLPYAPELFRQEFSSQIADMKNSVKDRANAQSSCAAQFVGNHLPPNNNVKWLHIDIAGPSWNSKKRGTGYGVGLLLGLGAEKSG